MATGTLVVSNPASVSPLSSVSTTLPNGTTIFVDRIGPGSGHTVNYVLSPSDVDIPLSVRETIVPATMTSGVPQQLRLVVTLQNTGPAHVTGFTYSKNLPSGLSTAWESHDGGSLSVAGTVNWAITDLGPGERKNLTIAFNTTSASALSFPASQISYDYAGTLSGSVPAMTASTNTTFQVQKSHITDHSWMVNATIPDDSEFDIVLDTVSVSRGDASDPFNTVVLHTYGPNADLAPGNSWTASLIDNFDPVPVYFLKLAYHMPYTTSTHSHVDASTAAIGIPIVTPTPVPSSSPLPPYATPVPSPTATPVPTVPAEPDIVFVAPGEGQVITGNATAVQTSVKPSADPGRVAYFVSSNNLTWIKLGEAPVSGTLSELLWTVPTLNGNYYLKAEHYGSNGSLIGVAYRQVLVAHETTPVDMTTLLISGTDWLMLLIALLAVMLLMFILFPYIRARPMIYDAAALHALSLEKGWRSKLPKEALRPDALLVEISGMDTIKMRALSNIDEMRRLERQYELSAYDAMALQLAREAGATLVTADPKVAGIAAQLDVKVKVMEKFAVPVTA